jgi:WD40 repeat protein
VHQEPVAPRQLQPTVPRDLETVCLKCLHKDPRRRYGSARELAEDLERFVAGTPVQARPIGLLERLAKWTRRRPGIAALLALVTVLTVVAFVLMAWQWELAEQRAVAEAAAKEEAAKRAQQERDARTAVETLTAGSIFDRASAVCERGDVAVGLAAFAEGRAMAARAGDTELERAFRYNLSAWRSRVIRERERLQHRSLVWAVAYSPRGDLVATASADRTVQLWDAGTGKPHGEPLPHDGPVRCVAFSPDGRTIVSGTDTDNAHRSGTITLWDTRAGKALRRWHSRHWVRQLHYARAGDLFVSLAAPEAQLFDATADEPLDDLRAPDDRHYAVAISPDGRTVVTGGYRGVLRRWDTAARPLEGVEMHQTGPAIGSIEKLTFSNDGKWLASATRLGPYAVEGRVPSAPRGEVRLWDVASGTQEGPALYDHDLVTALAFSPDNRLLAVGNSIMDWIADKRKHESVHGEVRLYEVATGQRLGRPLMHQLGVMALAFSPDGQFLLTGSQEGHARLFTVACGELIGAPMRHEGAVMSVAFAPDGRTAVTGSAGGDQFRGAAGRLWEWPTEAVPERILPFRAFEPMLAVHAADQILVANRDRNRPTTLTRFVLPGATPLEPGLEHPRGINGLCFSPDGRTLLTCCQDGMLRVWEAKTGTLRREVRCDDVPRHALFSPDGAALLTVDGFPNGYTLRLWDAAGLTVRCKQAHRTVHCAAFTPNGEALWLTDDQSHVQLWSWTPAAGIQKRWKKPLTYDPIAFTPDGRTILAWGLDRSVRCINVATGEPRTTTTALRPIAGARLALADDGRTLLVGAERTARLWDLRTDRPLGPPLFHHDAVRAVAFAAGGGQFVTMDASGTYLWRVPALSSEANRDNARRD